MVVNYFGLRVAIVESNIPYEMCGINIECVKSPKASLVDSNILFNFVNNMELLIYYKS